MCIFCEIPPERIIKSNSLALAFEDIYPVTKHHTLIIPKYHAKTYFDLTPYERESCNDLIMEMKESIEAKDPTVTGFNIGMNSGKSAGQTVFHCHIHLIPRRDGDMENPQGGVRGVIPDKQKY